MMDYQIVTNNPKIKSTYSNVIYIDGSFEEIGRASCRERV